MRYLLRKEQVLNILDWIVIGSMIGIVLSILGFIAYVCYTTGIWR